MQFTVTEDNEHEGETFSYVFEASRDEYDLVCELLSKSENAQEFVGVEADTTYSEKQIEFANDHSSNGYMDRINFYSLPNDFIDKYSTNEYRSGETCFYSMVIYKASGLIKIK